MCAHKFRIPDEAIGPVRSDSGRDKGLPAEILRVAVGLTLAIGLLVHLRSLAGTVEKRSARQNAISQRDVEPGPGERASVVLITPREGNNRDPQSAREYYNRASASYKAKQYDRAISQLNRAIRLEPGASLPYSLRGAIWLQKKEWDKAIADLNQAIQLEPQNAYAHIVLSSVWHEKNEDDKALAELNAAIQIDPRQPTAYASRGALWNSKGEFDKAIADCNEALRLNRREIFGYLHRAYAYNKKQEYARALPDWDNAIRLAPKLAEAHANRGITLMYMKKYDKAIAAMERGIVLNPDHPIPHLNRGITLFVLRRPGAEDELRKVLKSSEASRPQRTTAAMVGYFAARRDGRNDLAKPFLDEAALLSKTDGPYPVVAYLRGEIDEGKLLAAANNDERMSVARCCLALDLLQKGKPDAARAHFLWVTDHSRSSAEDFHLIAKVERDRMSDAK